uniref:Acidic protein n=1 Tax=Hordeum vulgare subsp. vulgare TaxID=112509 RepID=A0A8I6YFG0_HORVV
MAKYTTPIHSRVLLQALLLLICLATTTQCRITTDGINNDKINLPHGLCAYKKFIDAYCCLARNLCYATVDQCEKECPKSGSMVAMATPSLRTLSPLPST